MKTLHDLQPTLLHHQPRLHTNSNTSNLLCLFPLQETMHLLSRLKHRETVKPFSHHCNIFSRKLPSGSSNTLSSTYSTQPVWNKFSKKVDLFCFSLFSVIHVLLHSWMLLLNRAKVSLSTDAPPTCSPRQTFCLQETTNQRKSCLKMRGANTARFRQKMN